LYSETEIAQGTALYSTLISLTPGRKITIDGTFEITRNGTDYVGERSLTEAGSMTNPEFNFAFESISPAMDQDRSTASGSAPAEPATRTGAPEPTAILAAEEPPSSSFQATSDKLRFRDMIRQQNRKCESVVGVKTADTGQDVVTCQDHGDQYVYKILAGDTGPVVAMIDYHSGASSPETAPPTFECPESLPTDAARQEAVSNYLDWGMRTYPHWTIAQIVKQRVKLLESHHCDKTLANIRAKPP
jgi:hypothetical protein